MCHNGERIRDSMATLTEVLSVSLRLYRVELSSIVFSATFNLSVV